MKDNQRRENEEKKRNQSSFDDFACLKHFHGEVST